MSPEPRKNARARATESLDMAHHSPQTMEAERFLLKEAQIQASLAIAESIDRLTLAIRVGR